MSKSKKAVRKISLPQKLRELREEKQLTLTLAAAMLRIDIAVLSKIETGKRKVSKNIVIAASKAYKTNLQELLKLFYSEKILQLLENEDNPKEILTYVLKNLK